MKRKGFQGRRDQSSQVVVVLLAWVIRKRSEVTSSSSSLMIDDELPLQGSRHPGTLLVCSLLTYRQARARPCSCRRHTCSCDYFDSALANRLLTGCWQQPVIQCRQAEFGTNSILNTETTATFGCYVLVLAGLCIARLSIIVLLQVLLVSSHTLPEHRTNAIYVELCGKSATVTNP